MRDRDDSTQKLLEELVEQAVREAKLEAPLAVELKGEPEERPAARALGVIQNLGNTLAGPVWSIVNQAAPASSGTNWLKWLNPIAGLISLFTGRKKEEELPAPVMSPRPPKRSVEYGLVASAGGVFLGTDRDEAGRARMMESRVEGGAASQVVVQVQAMDSRSFLDHRDEIASAVKQALMESHGLGTVLSEFQE